METKFANCAPKQQMYPVIGCDYESQTGKQCDSWVHATCLSFPEAEDETFENITFRCPPHIRPNITSMNCKRKKTCYESSKTAFFLLDHIHRAIKNNTKVLIVTNKTLWKLVRSDYSICNLFYIIYRGKSEAVPQRGSSKILSCKYAANSQQNYCETTLLESRFCMGILF